MNEAMEKDRESRIVRASVIGILTNLLLAGFKAVLGMLSHSIAIVMDAVNNISDAASSVITIIGTRLAAKEPDRKHPFGYGRIEYLSAMIISVLVLYAGITAFVESVKKIVVPEEPDYGIVTLVIVAVAVIVKLLLGRYVKKTGEEVHSDSLINSGEDAAMDAVISAGTLVAAVIFLVFHISLEAWLGAVIAAVIVKSGVEMLSETLSKILGERADAELARAIKSTVTSYPEISGAYDLVLHNYGPDTFNGSVHIEVPDTLSADDLDQLIRRLSVEVYKKHHVILTAVGVYSLNTRDPEAVAAREKVSGIVLSDPYILQMHGFYYDAARKNIRFDLVVSFDAEDRKKVFRELVERVQKEYPDFTIEAAIDTDFSES
ncbi:MAG: cation transporter [Lachnospiraceae bacterium]|nr:cation transporter [Lachnospiraceae bacterium]